MKKIFLLFGQSNMAGADAVAPVPWVKESSDYRSCVYRYNSPASPAGDIIRTDLAPVNIPTFGCANGADTHGPEIGFSRHLQEQLPGEYVFVKVTGNIEPSESSFLWSPDQSYGRNMLAFLEAVKHLEKINDPPSAVLMAQGIDEALSENRIFHYKSNLYALINGIRRRFDSPDLPFIIGESIHSPYANTGSMTIVREAQHRASSELENVGFVSTGDLIP